MAAKPAAAATGSAIDKLSPAAKVGVGLLFFVLVGILYFVFVFSDDDTAITNARNRTGQLQQELFEGVRSGRADLRPQHATRLRERSFPQRKFAVENTRSRGAGRDLGRREISRKPLID